jgi:hypothetical protein
MVAHVGWTKQLKNLLAYHEQKVIGGVAERICAANFLYAPGELTAEKIFYQFNQLLLFRPDGSRPILHAHLDFHPQDAPRLSIDTFRDISRRYMAGIGMDDQPYVVYRHVDAAHPHCHIICPGIDHEGDPRQVYVKTGYNQMVKALEQEYQLTPGRRRPAEKEPASWRDQYARKLDYGRAPVVPTMARVIETLTGQYRIASLAAFNAALREYNIEAGEVLSKRTAHQHRGLVFRVLGPDGKRHGYIPSSRFDCKPTLPNLEKMFRENARLMERPRAYLIARIQSVTQQPHREISGYFAALRDERISTVIRHDKTGKIGGFIYIDHENRSVFEEKDLPGWCSAAEALAHFGHQRCLVARGPAPQKTNAPDAGITGTSDADKVVKAPHKAERINLSVATDLPEGSPLAGLLSINRKLPSREVSPERRPDRHPDNTPDM